MCAECFLHSNFFFIVLGVEVRNEQRDSSARSEKKELELRRSLSRMDCPFILTTSTAGGCDSTT